MSFTGERLPGADADFAVDRERHLAAYRFARAHAAGRAVLDAGSGEGYGAALLAEVAARVVGIDRAEAVRVAAARHRAPGLEFRAHDLERLGALGERFDLVVSFQVIEHVRDPVGFLRALARLGGALVVTTPNRLMSVSENPYHLREWTATELLALAAPVVPGARLLGVHGSARVLARERARGEEVRRLLGWDPLGLRRLVPRPSRGAPSRPWRAWCAGASPWAIGGRASGPRTSPSGPTTSTRRSTSWW